MGPCENPITDPDPTDQTLRVRVRVRVKTDLNRRSWSRPDDPHKTCSCIETTLVEPRSRAARCSDPPHECRSRFQTTHRSSHHMNPDGATETAPTITPHTPYFKLYSNPLSELTLGSQAPFLKVLQTSSLYGPYTAWLLVHSSRVPNPSRIHNYVQLITCIYIRYKQCSEELKLFTLSWHPKSSHSKSILLHAVLAGWQSSSLRPFCICRFSFWHRDKKD